MVPSGFRRAHIDADGPSPGRHRPAGVLVSVSNSAGAVSRLFRFEPTYAAHAVAAGLLLRPVGVITNPALGLRTQPSRFAEHHHLVEVRQRLLGDRLHERYG